jgi:hypothetical protein
MFAVCYGKFKAGGNPISLSKVRKILVLYAAVADLVVAHLPVEAAQG